MSSKVWKSDRIFYAVVILLGFALYFSWSIIIPFNHAPDEGMRYTIPQFIYQNGILPRGDDPSIRNEMYGFSYAFTPILSYMVSALFMKIVSIFSVNETVLLIAARFVSVCFSTGTILFCIKIGQKLFQGIYAKLFVIAICFLPQFVFISAYVNNDAFGIFTVAWIIYAMLDAKEQKWKLKNCVFLGIGVGLCLLSYYNCYGIIVVAIIYSIVSVIKDSTIENKTKFILTRLLWVFLVAFVVAGWWFIRNYILYDGDILGMRSSRELGELYAIEELKPSNRPTPHSMGMSLFGMLFDMGWLKYTCISFIGTFDYMNLFLNPSSYGIMFLIFAIGIIGTFLRVKQIGDKNDLLLKLMMFLMCAITIGLSVYYSYFSDFQAQGRYCLPMLIAFNVLLVDGWYKVSAKFTGNKRDSMAICFIMIYGIVICSSTFDILIPAYY